MTDSPQPFALLYPGDGSPDNAVLRCLGEAGVPVAVATSRFFVANSTSRYCRRRFRVPPPEKGAAAVVDRLIEIAGELGGRPVLFMLHDLAVMLGSKYRERLAPHYRGHFLDWPLLEVCNRHDRMFAAAQRAGVAVPATAPWPGTTREELDRIPKPCVVKPVSKYMVNGDNLWLEPFLRTFGKKALKAESSAEVESILDRCGSEGIPVVVQEYIPGRVRDLVTVVLYASGGRVVSHFTGLKLRQGPPDCGTCTYGESCPDSDEAVELARRLVTAIGCDGIAEVEFKRDRRDGRLTLIELNPRATVFCIIANAHGINLPLMAYNDLTDGAPRAAPEPAGKDVVRWMDPYRDLLQSGRTDGVSRVSLLGWLRQLHGTDLLCWGGRRDPLPLLLAPVQGVCEWLGDKFKSAKPPALSPIKGPADTGYLDYWEERSHQIGLRSVMWSNEDYNVLVDARQKGLLDRALGDIRGKKVLDLCCGTGRLSIHLARHGGEVVGVDLACMAEAAQRSNPHPRVSYVAGNAEALDFARDTFDIIVSVGAVACVCDSHAKFDAMIPQLHRLLKPGGMLITMEPFHVCPVIRRPLHMSPGAAVKHFERGGFKLLSKRSLLFQLSWLFLARPWWPAPRAVTSFLFRLGEATLRIPGVARLSDYKLLVLRKERP